MSKISDNLVSEFSRRRWPKLIADAADKRRQRLREDVRTVCRKLDCILHQRWRNIRHGFFEGAKRSDVSLLFFRQFFELAFFEIPDGGIPKASANFPAIFTWGSPSRLTLS